MRWMTWRAMSAWPWHAVFVKDLAVNQTIASVCHTFRGMKAASEAETGVDANPEAEVEAEAAAAAAAEAAALPAPEPAVGPGRYSSPSHMMPSNSRNEGLRFVA